MIQLSHNFIRNIYSRNDLPDWIKGDNDQRWTHPAEWADDDDDSDEGEGVSQYMPKK